MSSNRLKLNTEKKQFTCLGRPTQYQLAEVDYSVFMVSGAAVNLLYVSSPALALVSIKSSRLQITSEVSHVAASTGLGSYTFSQTNANVRHHHCLS